MHCDDDDDDDADKAYDIPTNKQFYKQSLQHFWPTFGIVCVSIFPVASIYVENE